MEKINICFHINDISKCGGTEKVTTQIASLLLHNYNCFNVTILSDYYDEIDGPFFKSNEKIKYARLYNNKIKSFKKEIFRLIYREHKYIKNNNIDILIGVDVLAALYDLPARFFTKTKYIAWEHFNYYSNLGFKLRDTARKLAYKYADKFVVLTKKDKKNYIKELGFNNNIITIYNPYTYNKKDIQRYDKSKKNYILSSGRLTDQKGFDILLEIANNLKKENTDFKWKILGDGEDKEKLLSIVKQYNLNDNIEFVGKVKDINKYYKDAKMFVLTSRYEGLGLVLLEAKGYGLPLISFDCNCGPSEIIVNNKNGYIVKDFNIKEITNKINNLLNNNDKCDEFSKNSLIDTEKFDEIKISEQWNKLLKDLMR